MGVQPGAGGQVGEGAAGVVGVDRRAPLGAEDQVELDRVGRLAGLDEAQPDLNRRPATALLLVRDYVAGTGFEPV